MLCPDCGTESRNARFCPECGTPLRVGSCADCGAELPAGARFCTRCGTPIAASAARRRGPVWPWVLGTIGFLLLLVLALIPAIGGDPAGPAQPMGPATTGGGGGAPPPLTGTPREQADRLFDRVMQAFASGDSSQASFFLPMAVQAYEMLPEMDVDGAYHLALLQLEAGRPHAAAETAGRILREVEPDHVLALGVAARAAHAVGDERQARELYARLLGVYDQQVGRPLPEYEAHAALLPAYREEARAYTGQ